MSEPREVVWWSHKPGEPAPSPGLLLPVVTEEYVSSFSKPRWGGLWTSPEDSGYGWENWCRDNELNWLADRYVLTVDGEPRTLVIDSHAALERAWKNYGRQRDWGDRNEYTDRDLNYGLIAEDYDALWLTETGHFDTRWGLGLNTSAWDCETVLWFRWRFASVRLCPAGVSA